jgi:copper chaperone CopZ
MKTDLPAIERLKLRIVGLDCVRCSLVINRALEGVKGVSKVGVSFMMDLVFVDYNPSLVSKGEIISIVRKTGYDAIPVAN